MNNNSKVIIGVIGIVFVLGLITTLMNMPENAPTSQPAPAQLTVLGLSAKTTTSIPVGWFATLEIVLGNTGDQDGRFAITLKDNDLNYKTEVVDIASQSQKTLEWKYSSSIIGDHTLSVNESSHVLTIKVLPIYTAKQIYDDYEANEIAADQKYKEKIFFVTGIIGSIGKDILDTPYVVLDVSTFGDVQCLFIKNLETTLAQYNKEDQVIIRGKGWSYLLNVMIEDCDLIQKLD